MVVDNVGSLWLRLSQEKSSICGQRPLAVKEEALWGKILTCCLKWLRLYLYFSFKWRIGRRLHLTLALMGAGAGARH